jgi:hypothetical protein
LDVGLFEIPNWAVRLVGLLPIIGFSIALIQRMNDFLQNISSARILALSASNNVITTN